VAARQVKLLARLKAAKSEPKKKYIIQTTIDREYTYLILEVISTRTKGFYKYSTYMVASKCGNKLIKSKMARAGLEPATHGL
jgi:hypothetical protein